jgi:hypothetical protein
MRRGSCAGLRIDWKASRPNYRMTTAFLMSVNPPAVIR